MLKYTEEHEWLKLEGDIATVGITEHATTLLGDIVFVQLPEVGAKLVKGDGANGFRIGAALTARVRVHRNESLSQALPQSSLFVFRQKLAFSSC